MKNGTMMKTALAAVAWLGVAGAVHADEVPAILAAATSDRNVQPIFLTDGDMTSIRGEGRVAVVIRGTRYCGPGNLGGSPLTRTDAACQRHDNSQGYSQGGIANYIPGLGSAAVQRADRQLISNTASILADSRASLGDRAQAAVVTGYFAGIKNPLDRAGSQVASTASRVASTARNLGNRVGQGVTTAISQIKNVGSRLGGKK